MDWSIARIFSWASGTVGFWVLTGYVAGDVDGVLLVLDGLVSLREPAASRTLLMLTQL